MKSLRAVLLLCVASPSITFASATSGSDAFVCARAGSQSWNVVRPDDLKTVAAGSRCIAVSVQPRTPDMMKCVNKDGTVSFANSPDFVIERSCSATTADVKTPLDK